MENSNNVATNTSKPLSAYFLPYLTPSHFMPLFQMAQLVASRGVHVTIISTPHNSLKFKDTVAQLVNMGHHIQVEIIPFPFQEVGLPEGLESLTSATSREIAGKLLRAFMMLQKPIEDAVRAAKPDCIVSDMHCFWASDLAIELGVPCLLFHARPFVGLCAIDAIYRYSPHKTVESDSDPFLLPGLPDLIQMCPSEIPDWIRKPNPYTFFVNKIQEGDKKSYGALVFSFYELEKDYGDHYRTTLGKRAWSIGPLALHCDAAFGGLLTNSDSNDPKEKHPCIEWLDTKPADSVLYVSFGSLSRFSSVQLLEIASALESSGHPFIWVVRKTEEKEDAKWLPEGFETRIKENNMGMLIEGWAPQVEILKHPALGGFMTHCGGNSIVESATAGVPMITWPLSADHFYHRKLVTHVAKIGVDVGNMKWGTMIDANDEIVEKEKIVSAIKELMAASVEAEDRRRRAKDFSEAAKIAVLPGGSSYDNLTALVDELQRIKDSNKQLIATS